MCLLMQVGFHVLCQTAHGKRVFSPFSSLNPNPNVPRTFMAKCKNKCSTEDTLLRRRGQVESLHLLSLRCFYHVSPSALCLFFFFFFFLVRPEEQVAPGGRPLDRPLSQVPGVFSQAAAVHLVAPGDPHHQDRGLLHHPRLRQGGTKATAQPAGCL